MGKGDHSQPGLSQICLRSVSGLSQICLRSQVSEINHNRLLWNKWTDPAIPECEETRQLMEHDNWHFNLGELFEREEVVKETGCKVPCSYVKYELANQVEYEQGNV